METPKPIRYKVTKSDVGVITSTLIVYASSSDEAEQIARGTKEILWTDSITEIDETYYQVEESVLDEPTEG